VGRALKPKTTVDYHFLSNGVEQKPKLSYKIFNIYTHFFFPFLILHLLLFFSIFTHSNSLLVRFVWLSDVRREERRKKLRKKSGEKVTIRM